MPDSVLYTSRGDQQQSGSCKAYSTVIGGFLAMMVTGSAYIAGTIDPYIHSYFNLSPDKRWESNLLPIFLVLTVFGMPIGSYFV